MPLKEQFLTLLSDSTIIQGVLTVLTVGVWLGLLATGHTTPDKLDSLVTLVVGFYFGAKVQNLVHKSGG
jgi:hypothetical protein